MPGDVSIVGFDDLPTASLLTPRLTTVRQPAHDLGVPRPRRLLFALIDDEGETGAARAASRRR